jgi:hypothetical protein
MGAQSLMAAFGGKADLSSSVNADLVLPWCSPLQFKGDTFVTDQKYPI